MTTQIAVVDLSTMVSPSDLLDIWIACVKQLREEACPAWKIPVPNCSFVNSESEAPAGFELIVMADTSDTAGAAGYHDVTPAGRPYAKAFFDGGVPSVTLSHELLEMAWDPYCNLYLPSPDGFGYAREACDAVEADTYQIDGITVSDFVYDAFFDAESAGPYDRLGLITKPFETRPGGYQIRDSGEPVWGAGYPEHKKALKRHKASRASRREVW